MTNKVNYFRVRKNLVLEPKHRENIGQAVWLLQYFFIYADWDTGKLNRRIGTIANDLSTIEKNVQRWMRKLEKHGYIKTRRLWHGYHIEINPKFLTGQNCLSKHEESSDIPRPVIGQKVDSDRTLCDQSDQSVQSLNGRKEKEILESPDINVQSNQFLIPGSLNKIRGIDSFDPESGKKWDEVKETLNQKILPDNFKTWFEPTVGLVVQPNRVLVAVPNRFYKKCLEENYRPQIREALLEAMGFENPPRPEFKIMAN